MPYIWFAFVKIIGCQPEQSAVLSASVKAGKILDLPSGETLSDATAGGMEPGAVSSTQSPSEADTTEHKNRYPMGTFVYCY